MSNLKKFIVMIMVVSAMLITVPKALAYFSTYTRVKGTLPVVLKDKTTFGETNVHGDKHIAITADEDSDPIFIRVKILAIDEIMDVMTIEYDEEKWTYADGYYEYTEVLMAGETAEMDISVDTTIIELTQFNVIVLYEYIPAIADGNGGYVKDWTAQWTGGGD